MQVITVVLHTQVGTQGWMTWLDGSIYVMLGAFLVLMALLIAKWLWDTMSGLAKGRYRVTLRNMALLVILAVVVFASLWEIYEFALHYGIETQEPFLKIVVLAALASGLLFTALELYRRRKR